MIQVLSVRQFKTTPERSALMSKIRSSGNKATEMAMIDLFRTNKITGWRRNFPVIGKPDFVFRACKVAVFVDGCFWHGCKSCFHTPRSNTAYWVEKIRKNKLRDRKVSSNLRAQGWKVLRVWEHSMTHPGRVAQRIRRYLNT